MRNIEAGPDHKAVIYARVSSKDQEREGFSIPAQVKLLNDYAGKNGLEVVREFIDVETAKQAGRTAFNEMVAFLNEDKGIRHILVEKTDRLYRNFKDYVNLEDLHLEIHLVKESEIINQESRSHAKFIHGIKVLMAKNYVDNLSEETKKGMIEKAGQGIYPSCAPLGYLNVEENGTKIIEPDPDIAPLIRKLFEWYGTGNYSITALASKAYEAGLVYRKTGGRVNRSVVHKILNNPIYYGEFIWKGTRYRGKHTPLISKAKFDQAQEVRRVNGRNRKCERKHKWAFTGLITCGHCGCAFTAERKKGKYVYYHCTGARGKCPEKFVREEEVAAQFGEALRAIQLDEDVLEWMVKALKESHVDEKQYHDDCIKALNRQYQRLQDRIGAMYIDKLDGEITQKFFDEKSDEWRREQEDIIDKIRTHQQANKSYIDEGIRFLELGQRAAFLYAKQDDMEKRKILDFLLSNSKWKDGKLIPNYRKPFDLLAEVNEEAKRKTTAIPGNGGQNNQWLPVVDKIRTLFIAPSFEIRLTLEAAKNFALDKSILPPLSPILRVV